MGGRKRDEDGGWRCRVSGFAEPENKWKEKQRKEKKKGKGGGGGEGGGAADGGR